MERSGLIGVMAFQPAVFVVDDDAVIRRLIEQLVEAAGLNVTSCASAQEFLDAYDPARPGCLVLDVQMPGMNGLELQDKLARSGIRIPVIFISDIPHVPMALRAMKANAVDFLVKPFNGEVLLACIQEAIQRDIQDREHLAARDGIRARLALLTPRERQVMELVAQGNTNRQIATQLGLSEKTVETHRAKVMKKLDAESVVDLVRSAMQSDDTKRAGRQTQGLADEQLSDYLDEIWNKKSQGAVRGFP